MKRNALLIFGLTVLLFSCKEPIDPPPADVDYVQLSMVPFYGTETLSLDSTYTTDEGYRIQFVNIKAYFCQLKNGTDVLMNSSLFDFAARGTLLRKVPGDYTLFSDLKGLIGVDAIQNHADPAQLANDDPLNIMLSNDMHWDWNPGYIFFKVEAKADTLVDAVDNLDVILSYHVGGDDNLQNVNLPGLNWQAIGARTHEAKLKMNLKQFFTNPASPIDIKTERTIHSGAGQEAVTLKAAQNFKSAISVY
ncbi:MAG: MbnP family protein [Bacteroidota bacterium]